MMSNRKNVLIDLLLSYLLYEWINLLLPGGYAS
jgi:hypothetical protein